MRLHSLLTVVLIGVLASSAQAADPERNKGISVHMLPSRVAQLSGKSGGFIVSYGSHLKPEVGQPALTSVAELAQFVDQQEQDVQHNGLWIVTTHPSAYSEAEKQLLEDVKAWCRKDKVPLFIARGSQLPDGWERYE